MTEPFKRGDWVAETEGNHPRIARVVAYHPVSEFNDEPAACLCLYAFDGTKIGRESPALGGPKGHEPFCSIEQWSLVEEPEFPLRRCGLMGEWRSGLKYLEEQDER